MFKCSIVLWSLVVVTSQCNTGHFWQVTDIHYDANYSSPTSQELAACEEGRGRFGEYPCDSPWTLVTSALSWMHKAHPHPDFIIWTGDSIPHVEDSQLDAQKVFSLIRNVTEELMSLFPESRIYPSIGNHDVWPSNQVPSGQAEDYYKNLLTLSGWHKMLGKEASEQFLQGGFYTSGQGDLRLVAVNSVLWYASDREPGNATDPLRQFVWLNEQLQQAREQGNKVLLHGHVPPGTMGRGGTEAGGLAWYRPSPNTELTQLLTEYSDVVAAAVFGHEHTDSFRVISASNSKGGEPLIPMYVSPAVTPWESPVPGIGAVNPSVRLYSYCRTSGLVKDYDQYFLNLTRANIDNRDDWELEYSLTQAYNIPDGSARSLRNVVDELARDRGSFEAYFRYNSVSQDEGARCEGKCAVRHLCAMLYVEYEAYGECVRQGVEGVGDEEGEGDGEGNGEGEGVAGAGEGDGEGDEEVDREGDKRWFPYTASDTWLWEKGSRGDRKNAPKADGKEAQDANKHQHTGDETLTYHANKSVNDDDKIHDSNTDDNDGNKKLDDGNKALNYTNKAHDDSTEILIAVHDSNKTLRANHTESNDSNNDIAGHGKDKEAGLSGTALSIIAVLSGLCGLTLITAVIWVSTNGLNRVSDREMTYSVLNNVDTA